MNNTHVKLNAQPLAISVESKPPYIFFCFPKHTFSLFLPNHLSLTHSLSFSFSFFCTHTHTRSFLYSLLTFSLSHSLSLLFISSPPPLSLSLSLSRFSHAFYCPTFCTLVYSIFCPYPLIPRKYPKGSFFFQGTAFNLNHVSFLPFLSLKAPRKRKILTCKISFGGRRHIFFSSSFGK